MTKAKSDSSVGGEDSGTGVFHSDEYLDIDKIVDPEKVVNTSYYAAVISREVNKGEVPASIIQIVRILQSIMQMNVSIDPFHQVFELSAYPFGGKRSMIPDDIFDDNLVMVSNYAKRINHPVIKARFAHLAWFLKPDNVTVGTMALDAYVDVLVGIEKNVYTAKDEYKSSSFIIVEYFYSTFRVLAGLEYPSDKNKEFVTLLEKFSAKFLSNGDIYAFFRLVELMIYHSKIDCQIIENVLMKFFNKKRH